MSLWFPAVNVFTWNSLPAAFPSLSKRWPETPEPLPSCFSLLHTTRRSPSSSEPTEGALWFSGVYELTWNSVPAKLPSLAKRCAKTPVEDPS